MYRNIDYKVLRAIPGRFSPLRNIPPPDQKPETRGINIKTGPFVRAESVKVRPWPAPSLKGRKVWKVKKWD
jgi:hypothetical protein